MDGPPHGRAPTVTIGMPVRNGADDLPRALDSLVRQTFRDFELIISDNASTDATAGIAQGFVERDPRLRYLRQPSDIGPIANFELLARQARGRYFMWAADDDVWDESFVEVMVETLERDARAAVAMCAVERFRPDGTVIDTVRWGPEDDPSRFGPLRLACRVANRYLYYLYVYGLYRREFLQRALLSGFPTARGGDRLFVCQAALATRFAYVDRVLHRRQLVDVPRSVRYPEEALGPAWRYQWAHWKRAFAAGSGVIRSKVVPTRRKIYAPIIVALFSRRALSKSATAVSRRLALRTGRRRSAA